MTVETRAGEIPQLGPYLGRLADLGRRFPEEDVALDQVRLGLVSDLLERAAAARGFLVTGDEAAARAALGRGTWLEVWRKAAEQAAARTIAAVEGRLRAAATRSRYPARRLRPLMPNDEDRAILRNQLTAAGLDLEEALAQLSGAPLPPWEEVVRRLAGQLDAAWDRLEGLLHQELGYWAPRVQSIAAWRRSSAGVWVAVALVAILAGWLGLAIGGFLPSPPFLAPFAAWFWSLPWP